jgi:hypothetical protein
LGNLIRPAAPLKAFIIDSTYPVESNGVWFCAQNLVINGDVMHADLGQQEI